LNIKLCQANVLRIKITITINH